MEFEEILKTIIKSRNEGDLSIRISLRILENYRDRLGNDYETLISELVFLSKVISELQQQAELLFEKGVKDSVTKLNSRAYLDDKCSSLTEEYSLAFIIGDIDKFGEYNKKYGHVQGDVALKIIAQQFKRAIEDRLVRDEVAFVARYGGEEFCAFIRNYERDLQSLQELVEGVRKDIETLEIPPVEKYEDSGFRHRTITIAAGIRRKKESLDDFMRDVINLLRKKVEEGRNKTYLRK
ncbi:hypothetical protein DRJ19_00760 [Candidatus Woesearchaeota archaeon]|nr:MAG: hypothetical protein DRJ19_00760 [Candidatus Woesearchaeota archaeon]